MKQEVIYLALSDSCRWNDHKAVKTLLKSNQDLDILRSDGLYFHLAVKHNNVPMLNALLQYYRDSIKDEPFSLEHNYKGI